jgi:hypothetical protein
MAVPDVDKFGIAWKRPNHNVIDTACEDCGARITKFDTLKAMKARGETTTSRMLNSSRHWEQKVAAMKAQDEQFDKRMKALGSLPKHKFPQTRIEKALKALDEVKEAETELAPKLYLNKYLDPQFDLDREYEERVAKRVRAIEAASANH